MNSSLVTALSEASWNSLNLEHPQEARCNPTRLCKTYWKLEARRTPFRVVLKLDCTQSNCEATPHSCTTNRINNKSIIEKSNVKARSWYDNIHQKISPSFFFKKGAKQAAKHSWSKNFGIQFGLWDRFFMKIIQKWKLKN